jgi:hypothetical protein
MLFARLIKQRSTRASIALNALSLPSSTTRFNHRKNGGVLLDCLTSSSFKRSLPVQSELGRDRFFIHACTCRCRSMNVARSFMLNLTQRPILTVGNLPDATSAATVRGHTPNNFAARGVGTNIGASSWVGSWRAIFVFMG